MRGVRLARNFPSGRTGLNAGSWRRFLQTVARWFEQRQRAWLFLRKRDRMPTSRFCVEATLELAHRT